MQFHRKKKKQKQKTQELDCLKVYRKTHENTRT